MANHTLTCSQYALSLLAVLNGRERVRAAAVDASHKGTYQFSRKVLTTVSAPAAPHPTELEGGRVACARGWRLWWGAGGGGRGRERGGDAMVEVELGSFLDSRDVQKRSRSRLEKDGI